jgi:hypothetical protein
MMESYQQWLANEKAALDNKAPLGRPACLQIDEDSGLYRGDTIRKMMKRERKARYESSLLAERRNRERIEEVKVKAEEARNQPKVKRAKIGTARGGRTGGNSSRGGDTT